MFPPPKKGYSEDAETAMTYGMFANLKPRYSLQLQVSALMAALVLMAVFSMMSSLWITRAIQGEVTAVNIAGSLRMQSYRIATQLLSSTEFDKEMHWQRMQRMVQAFESSLKGHSLTDILPNEHNHKIRSTYEQVDLRWTIEIKPLLNVYIHGIIPLPVSEPATASKQWGMISDHTVKSLRIRYLAMTPNFVDLIDQFVKALEENTENKIQKLRRLQWIAFIITIGGVLFALWFAKRHIVTPLNYLLISAKSAKEGDFSKITPHTSKDELGRLGSAFNEMGQTLSKLYADLEERVQIKTADLEHSNRSLEILYRTVNRLSTTDFPHATYQDMLEDISTLAKTGPANICLTNTITDKAYNIATTRKPNDGLHVCEKQECNKCFGDRTTHFFDQPTPSKTIHQVISIPIEDSRHHHGVLLVEALDETGFAEWQRRMLEAVANHIAIAISMSNQHAEQSRLALLEERGVIARELHDSLAQSLSYAKIQVSRLNAVLDKGKEQQKTTKDKTTDDLVSEDLISEARLVSDELREGLNRAYRELRELLTTFRLTMEDHDLNRTIQNTVQEFCQRSTIQISFSSDCPNGLLDPNEEIHLLQIIRESLSNIIQHSQASKAQLFLLRSAGGKIELRIEDNGIGIKQDRTSERQHYGLVIMRERALNLDGDLIIDSSNKGTLLRLVFTPASSTEKPDKPQALSGSTPSLETLNS